jgi:hypothetical protein
MVKTRALTRFFMGELFKKLADPEYILFTLLLPIVAYWMLEPVRRWSLKVLGAGSTVAKEKLRRMDALENAEVALMVEHPELISMTLLDGIRLMIFAGAIFGGSVVAISAISVFHLPSWLHWVVILLNAPVSVKASRSLRRGHEAYIAYKSKLLVTPRL